MFLPAQYPYERALSYAFVGDVMPFFRFMVLVELLLQVIG